MVLLRLLGSVKAKSAVVTVVVLRLRGCGAEVDVGVIRPWLYTSAPHPLHFYAAVYWRDNIIRSITLGVSGLYRGGEGRC